jgi:hypothetical protein
MNPFDQEFRGNLLLSDRQYNITFVVPANKNNSEWAVAWNNEPYDLSTYNTLAVYVSTNSRNYGRITVNIAGSTAASTKASEIVTILNADANFSQYFTAETIQPNPSSTTVRLNFKLARTQGKFFVDNGGAESKLKFNKKAGIAEIPTYFARHTLFNGSYDDDPSAVPHLIQLDGTDTAADGDRVIIREFLNNSSWTNSDLKADYTLLQGRSGIFLFRKTTVDGNSPVRPSVVIEYHAGARAGDLAKRITYTYSGTTNTVLNYTEEPYVLQSGDLITPV